MKIINELPAEFKGNSAFMNIMERTSVRKFKDLPVDDSQLSAILHAAMSAPSGVNMQPWEFIVVTDRNLLDRLSDSLPYAKMTSKAQLAIVVCGNRERFLEGDDSNLWEQDLSAASENILLAAHAIGLGGVWTCLYPHADRMESVKEILNISDNLTPFNLIPIGVPEVSHAPMDKWHPERIHMNRFQS